MHPMQRKFAFKTVQLNTLKLIVPLRQNLKYFPVSFFMLDMVTGE